MVRLKPGNFLRPAIRFGVFPRLTPARHCSFFLYGIPIGQEPWVGSGYLCLYSLTNCQFNFANSFHFRWGFAFFLTNTKTKN